MENVEKAFNGLGRTKKVEFISKNIELASSSAVADYVKGISSMCSKMWAMMSM